MEEEWIKDVVWVSRDRKNEWVSGLEEEFGEDIRFREELKKDLTILWLAVEVLIKSYEKYQKYKEYKKRRQEEGFPVRDKNPD